MSVSIVIFLQILFLVIIIIDGERTFDCTGYEDDSYHPIYDAGDCRHYWHCIYVNTVYMHAVKRVCPAGTEFDPTLRKCETSSLVNIDNFIFLDKNISNESFSGRLHTSDITFYAKENFNYKSMEMEIFKIIITKTLENNTTTFYENKTTSYI